MVRSVTLVLLTIKIALLVNTGAEGQGCYRERELELEIRSALTTINERLGSLENRLNKGLKEAEEKILDQIEKRSSNQDENIKWELAKQDENFKGEVLKLKKEIISETEIIAAYSHLTGINDDVKINNDTSLPSDCKEVQERRFNSSGTYRIQPRLSTSAFLVWCDMKTEKGGWTYIMSRFDGSENFYLNWTEYKRGFGNLSGEHWLGLEHMYELTNSKSYQLLIELVDWQSTKAQAFYSNFRIGNESEDYTLKSLGSFRGNTADSFSDHVGLKFSTPDRDHDNLEEKTCAVDYKSGWWFSHCVRVLLTGQYINNPLPNSNFSRRSAIKWGAFHGYSYSLKEARMMIRPA